MASANSRRGARACGMSLRVAILDDYQNVALRLADWNSIGEDVAAQSLREHLFTEDDAAERLADFDVLVLMRERFGISASLMARLPRLKYIVVTGSHTQIVDVAAAKARGIPVSLTGATASWSAAEHTWALLLALARNIAIEDRNMREGRWMSEVGFRLEGKTIGLLGLGNLGARVAHYARAFDMKVIAWSENLTAERAQEAGAEWVTKNELLASADVISVQLKLSLRTRGLIGAAEFAKMKRSAVFINTSRGPIVDEAAMIQALENGLILRAGLDVYDSEPMAPDHPLRSVKNTVLTPHIGFSVEEGLHEFYREAAALIRDWRAGRVRNVYDGFRG